MKRFIAFKTSFAHIFERTVANYNIACESRISVVYAAPNAVEFISTENESDNEVVKKLMTQYEGAWVDELPPPVVYVNPMPFSPRKPPTPGWTRTLGLR